jgi:hypothetical protein
MKYCLLELSLIFTLAGYSMGFAQQNMITSYQNRLKTELNISLSGRVKFLRQSSYYTNSNSSDTISYIFNNQGSPTQIIKNDRALFNPGSGKKIYDFENGNLISEKYYENNTLLFGTNLKYDNMGRLLESSKYSNNENLKRKAGKPFFIETYQYNNQGQQTVYTMDNISGEIFHKWVYKYDTNGNKIEEGSCENYKGINNPADCNYKALHGYEYNDKSQLTKKFDIGKWSPNNTDTYYQYDEHGNEIEVKGYYITNVKVLGYHFVYQYDEYGNRIREEEKSGNYSRIDFDKYKYLIMRYDINRNLVQKEYYAPDDKQIKVIRFNYTYDNFGNWIKREKYEGKTEFELSKIEVDDRDIEYFQ